MERIDYVSVYYRVKAGDVMINFWRGCDRGRFFYRDMCSESLNRLCRVITEYASRNEWRIDLFCDGWGALNLLRPLMKGG